MDELDILKKDWQKKGEELPKLSYNDIYKMIWKKSSSIVKWILIISILELTLPHLLYLLPSAREQMTVHYNSGILSTVFILMTIVQYLIVVYFIYQFYKCYREISVLDNSKTLMANIIKTRRTVKLYIIYSLSMIFVMMLIFAIGSYYSPELLQTILEQNPAPPNLDTDSIKTILLIGFIVVGLVLIGVFALLYFLIYGLLLRKLKKNYKELKRMEV